MDNIYPWAAIVILSLVFIFSVAMRKLANRLSFVLYLIFLALSAYLCGFFMNYTARIGYDCEDELASGLFSVACASFGCFVSILIS